MKKIRNFPRYRKLQERRGKRADREPGRRSRGSRRTFSIARVRQEVLTQGLGYLTLEAPRNFSLARNPEEMIEFISELKRILAVLKRNVLLDLSMVTKVRNDAIILVLSVVQDRTLKRGLKVYIKKPNNEAAANRLRESGIEEYYEIQRVGQPKSGRIRVRSSYDANSEIANELIQHATRTLFGKRRPLKKVQRILAECIANTEEHAGGDPNRTKVKMWWGSVFCDRANNVAYFSLLDNGVGIIESLKTDWFQRLPQLAKYGNSISLMRAVFDKKVLSRTNLSNRGNGLPAIFRARAKREFTNLILITNNVYIDFDKNEYRLLKDSFSGTFFHWEVAGTEHANHD